ncbi:hypothetical protein ACH5RR_005381 [Cinchona calisaya]|uniref:Membrane-associated kinase regulator 4 n=1 Tax=Cinchona calisaya TaxID=153742 RepID=A0ABD3AKZ6_9GENT
MATNLSPCQSADEDYIDMEIESSSHNLIFCCSEGNTSPQSREFEFQMSSTSNGRGESTTSPADELFYKGKLLPLYLPPRFQMVQSSSSSCTAPSSTNASTPLYSSCNISPSESCRVSCELNPAEYFFEWSTEFSSLINNSSHHPKKSYWSKKLEMIKQSLLTQKLKASRAYLKSLFSSKNIDHKKGIEENNKHWRSFSGAIKRHSPSKCLSSSTSSSSSSSTSSSSSYLLNSNVLYRLKSLKRSSSAASDDTEISIRSAIAYCKNSEHIFNSRKDQVCEAGLIYSSSLSRIAPSENQEKAVVCNI